MIVSIPTQEGAQMLVNQLNEIIRNTLKARTGLETHFQFEFYTYIDTQNLFKTKHGFFMDPPKRFFASSKVEAFQQFLNYFTNEDKKMKIRGRENGKEFFFFLFMKNEKWQIEEAAAVTTH